ncbi:hypothetical protein [Acerihabitans arboris]|uniref:Uncharacterized protein n=1 Tax=Acerihabitans arboris TaxID=2691583 RepID=A0A845SD30_9GAMM|nr:hypothetical protein [Acerihabitans arboris]NDL62813.1 hypothetical protein [Acerihabitans arboris]
MHADNSIIDISLRLDNSSELIVKNKTTCLIGELCQVYNFEHAICGNIKKVINYNITHDDKNNNHEDEIDYLFACRNELKSNQALLAQGCGSRYIRIEIDNDCIFVLARKITLPSGNKIYAGLFHDKLLVSDGYNYHIEDLVATAHESLFSTLFSLIFHLSGVLNSYYQLAFVSQKNSQYSCTTPSISTLVMVPNANTDGPSLGKVNSAWPKGLVWNDIFRHFSRSGGGRRHR